MRKRVTGKKSVREVLIECFKKGMTNADALENMKRRHPYSTMSLATVNWLRNKLRSDGLVIMSEREAREKTA